jgi:hypothetical protein
MKDIVALDRITRVAPLGLGFWDSVSNNFVTDGLRVTAIPKISSTYRGKPATALPNRSGIFAFCHLPGLGEAENGVGDHDYWSHPPAPKDFVVSVIDRESRFLPFKFSIQAPTRRAEVWSIPSPGTIPNIDFPQLQGIIPLFSSPARLIPSGTAVIRASITMEGKPAAWAIVEAYSQNVGANPDDTSLVARGIANQRGQLALVFHYPKFMSMEAGKDALPLTAQKWVISLKVFFSPRRSDTEFSYLEMPYLEILDPETLNRKIPDLGEIAVQAETDLVTPLELPDKNLPAGKAYLKYGTELVFKTRSASELQIKAKS